MHPWFKVLVAHISSVLEINTSIYQDSLMLLQLICDKYNIASVNLVCELLSKYLFIDIQTIKQSKNQLSSFFSINKSEIHDENDISDKKDNFKDFYILVCKILPDPSSRSGNIVVQDKTGKLSCVYPKASFSSINSLGIVLEWNYIIDQKQSLYEIKNLSTKISCYVEIKAMFFLKSNKPKNIEDGKLNISLNGVLIRKSCLSKINDGVPFFIVMLKSLVDSQILTVVVQGKVFAHWYWCLRINCMYNINGLQLGIVNKVEQKHNIFLTSESAFCRQLKVPQHYKEMCIKTSSGMINYQGVITSTGYAEFGILELDGKIKLIACLTTFSQFGRGLREGAEVFVHNAHLLIYGSKKILCCCSTSEIKVVNLSSTQSSYNVVFPQLHPIASQLRFYSIEYYIAMVKFLKKLFSTAYQTLVLTLKEKPGKLLSLLKWVFTHDESILRPSVFAEFLNMPHSCIYTNKSSFVSKIAIKLNTLKEFRNLVTIITESNNKNLQSGSISKVFSFHHCSDGWSYAKINSSQLSIILCGLFSNNTIVDSTSHIHLVCTGQDISHLNGHGIIVNKYELIIEKYCYKEFQISSGKYFNRVYTRMYLVISSLDDIFSVNNIASITSIKLHPKKKLKLNEENCLFGTIFWRSFKRSKKFLFDTELHSRNKIYVPGLGRQSEDFLSESLQSLYPYCTSFLIVSLYVHQTKKITPVYFDSNKLFYPLGMLPGGLVKFFGLQLVKSDRSTFFKFNSTSRFKMIKLPFLYEDFNSLIESFNIMQNERINLIALVLDKASGKNSVFLIVARVTFIQSIKMSWKCSLCKNVLIHNICSNECKGEKKFLVYVRALVDDGTAECVLDFDQEVAKVLLNISDNEYDNLKSKSYHYGVLEYYRGSKVKNQSHCYTKSIECQRILQRVSQHTEPYNLREFLCKQYKKENQNMLLSTLVSENVEYQTICHAKVFLQCLAFRPINYH